jgi:sugar phosphate isomerase/epimerase
VPLPLAVQLYTFRDPARFGGTGLGLDLATLEAVAAAGYLGVETVDVPGGDAEEARRVMADLGLAVTSSHTWSDVEDVDAFERALAALAELGSPRVIVSGAGFASVDAVARFADRLTAAAEVAARSGLGFAYHNHSAEMAVLEGMPVIDRIAARTSLAVDFQVDIFWVQVGGAAPADVIGRLAPRVVSLHLKDGVELPATPDEPFVNVPVGDGAVDPGPAVAAAGQSPDVDWLIVEFDHVAGSPIDGVRRSARNLLEAGLARGRTA